MWILSLRSLRLCVKMYPKFVYVLFRRVVYQACTRNKLIRFVRFMSHAETQRTQSGSGLPNLIGVFKEDGKTLRCTYNIFMELNPQKSRFTRVLLLMI